MTLRLLTLVARASQSTLTTYVNPRPRWFNLGTMLFCDEMQLIQRRVGTALRRTMTSVNHALQVWPLGRPQGVQADGVE